MKQKIRFDKKNFLVLFSAFLLLVSTVHFLKTGVQFAHTLTAEGDFSASFPIYWGWKLNPRLMQGNPTALRWANSQTSYCLTNLDFEHPSPTHQQDFNRCWDLEKSTPRVWIYGPAMYVLTLPLYLLPTYGAAFQFWLYVNYLLIFATMGIWYYLLFQRQQLGSLFSFSVFSFVWLNFFPLYEALVIRVIEISELFFISLAVLFLVKNKQTRAGFVLGTAVMTKFLPIVYLPFLLITRRWKALAAASAVIAVIALVTQFTMGWKGNLVLNSNLQGLGYGWSWFESQSIPSAIVRLFSDFSLSDKVLNTVPGLRKDVDPAQVQSLVRIVLFAVSLVFGLVLWFARKQQEPYFAIALITVLMIALPQSNHIYYLVFLLIPYSVALQYLFRTYSKGSLKFKFETTLLGISYLLVGLILPLSGYAKLFSFFSHHPFLSVYQLYSVTVYGYLILMGWLGWRLTMPLAQTNAQEKNLKFNPRPVGVES